jgi:Na+/proline symporter
MDFYKPLTGGSKSEDFYLKFSRIVTLVWGAVLFLIALVAQNWGSVLQAGLSIASILYGSLLGVFLLGLLTKRTSEPAAMGGMLAGFFLMLYIKFFTPIAWTWYVLIGTSVTFGVGYLLSYAIQNEDSRGTS